MVGRMSLPSDADDDAQKLQNYLMQCTSRDISAACQAVEAQLQTVGGEHVRDFYRLCFPILLRKIFGFEDSTVAAQPASSAGGWLAQASVPGNEAAARALIALLSPRGSLFSSLLAVDKENFVRYVFPMERLPEWVRKLLSQEKGAQILCQVSALFKNRIMEDANGCMQVHLDVFEYYMFWFAYYAVCKDVNQPQAAAGGIRRRYTPSRSFQFRMQLENWASSIPRLSHSPQAVGIGGSPYLQLLKLYLSHFVMLSRPTRGYPGLELGDGGSATHGDILIYTMIEFWLVDDDPSPLPLATRQSLGFQVGGTAPGLSYIPPGSDLTDSLKVLIKFLNSNFRLSIGEHSLANSSSSPVIDYSLNLRRKLSESPSGHFSSPLSLSPSFGTSQFPSPSNAYLQALHRPLYRFLLRAFRQWPMGTPVRKIAQVVDVWVDYLEPWNTGLDAANAREQAQQKNVDSMGSRDSGPRLSPSLSLKKSNGGSGIGFTSSKALDRRIAAESFTELWQGYVLVNYLFYTSLVTTFLEFALRFVHLDPEAIFQMVFKVLSVLAKSQELLDLLRKVDAAYGGHMYGRLHQRSNALLDLAPTIQEQLQDWEEGAETDDEQERGDGLMMRSPLRSKSPQLKLFSMMDNGGNRLLQALFMRAEVEIQASSSEKPPLSAQALESVKDVARKIFDLHTVESPLGIYQPAYCQSPLASQPDNHSDRDAAATNRSLGLQRHSWQDVKYKGDWMRRPIESTEVAFLARLFVRVSDAINSTLGLTPSSDAKVSEVPTGNEGVDEDADQADPSEVVLPSSGQNEVKLSDILNFIKNLLLQILMILQQEARDRGWRVNFRFMAEKKFLVLSVLALLFYWAVRTITGFIASYFR